MTKKRPAFSYALCVSCGICTQSCPVSVLVMRREGSSGKYRNLFPELAGEGCLGCCICARACPMEVIRMEEIGDES